MRVDKNLSFVLSPKAADSDTKRRAVSSPKTAFAREVVAGFATKYRNSAVPVRTVAHAWALKYQGFLVVKDADMKLALKHATRVLNETENWLLQNKPEIFKR